MAMHIEVSLNAAKGFHTLQEVRVHLASQLDKGEEVAGLDPHPHAQGGVLLHLDARRRPKKAAGRSWACRLLHSFW